MHSLQHVLAVLPLACTLASAVPTSLSRNAPAQLERRAGSNPYQPVTTTCPDASLIRTADAINGLEADYLVSRKEKADEALASWLAKQGSFSTESQPSIGLTSSGGGLRATLEGAGVVQGFDARDSNTSVSGIYQALTYQAGLSGGAWFLSSLAGNNWPTVSYLRDNLWEQAFENTLLLPANLFSVSGLTEYGLITTQLIDKQDADYDITIVDPYGRLLSYQLLEGASGGVGTYMSSLDGFANFTEFNVPYPIITALGALASEGQCTPPLNATQYEFTPHEFGSWDAGIAAFTPVEYLGSRLNDGQPVEPDECAIQYDNLGYILGTSSDIFPSVCSVISPANSSSASLANNLEGMVSQAHEPLFEDLFAIYPNPFYNSSGSESVASYEDLTLADGGLSNQNNPIWPFLQPARAVDVLIVNDNSADTDDNFPNGTEIRQTYLAAQAAGLTKMPFIPDVDVFTAQNLSQRATFFGCNETDTVFIVFLPNVAYTYDSGQSTSKIQYDVDTTNAMIDNGVQIAIQGGDSGWAFCLACAIKNGDGDGLPEGCNACFEEYCYYEDSASG